MHDLDLLVRFAAAFSGLKGADVESEDELGQAIRLHPGTIRSLVLLVLRNAQLIAAAPELLAALKAVVSDPKSADLRFDVLSAIDAAIAKAEGK